VRIRVDTVKSPDALTAMNRPDGVELGYRQEVVGDTLAKGSAAEEYLHFEEVFNKSGRTLGRKIYDASGAVIEMSKTTYNDDGLPIEEITEYVMEGREEKVTIEYDKEARKVVRKNHYEDGSFSKEVSLADENDRLAETQSFDVDGTLIETQHFHYDEKGNITRTDHLDENNDLVESHKQLIDRENSVLVQQVYDSAGELLSEEKADVDENGNILSMEHAQGQVTFIEYDEKSNPIEERTEMNGGVIQKINRTYDAKGNVTKEAYYQNLNYYYDDAQNYRVRVERMSAEEFKAHGNI